MSAAKLRAALAKVRAIRLSPPVTTADRHGGDGPAGGETQAPQGFEEAVTTVTTVTTENVARPKIHPCGPAARRSRRIIIEIGGDRW